VFVIGGTAFDLADAHKSVVGHTVLQNCATIKVSVRDNDSVLDEGVSPREEKIDGIETHADQKADVGP
jgi:hypothetical protein